MHALLRSLLLAAIVLGSSVPSAWAADKALDAAQLKALTPEQATELVAQGKPLRLEVTELSPQVAAILADAGQLELPKLTDLPAPVAKALARHAGKLALGVKELSDETAAALAERVGDTELHGLTSLTSLALAERLGRQPVVWLNSVRRITPEIARALNPPVDLAARDKDGNQSNRWIDIGLTELSPEAAAAIVASRHGFAMHSLESLSAEAAEAMSVPQFLNMRMWGLKTLSPAAAAALAKGSGILDIRYFGPEISAEAAEALAKQMRSSPTRAVDLNGLKKLSSPALAIAALLKSDIRSGPHGSLNGVTEVTDEVARALAECKDTINMLPSLTSLTSAPLAAKYVSQSQRGDISFRRLAMISDDVAAALATHKGKVDLSGLKSLSVPAARSFAAHEGDLVLDGLEEIGDEADESLAKSVSTVSLKGLKKASPAARSALRANAKIGLPAEPN